MQALVYIFIALAALGVGATAYFGLTFTPVEAAMAAIVFAAVAVVLLERTLRQRSEQRFEKAIAELSRLLSTDAQAGAALSQRVNKLAEDNAGKRLEMVEADISVLGTVIRQVAEALAEIEERGPGAKPAAGAPAKSQAAPRRPTIPLETVRRAIAENRLIHHTQPVVTLPQRRTFGYDLVPRLMLEDGDLAEAPEFLPTRGGEDVLIAVDGAALTEAITIGRRARTNGQPLNLFVPLSRATLADRDAGDQLLASLEANRTIAESLIFLTSEADWQALAAPQRTIAEQVTRKGASFSLTETTSLRHEFADLSRQGVHSLRIDAAAFLADPQAFTDFHVSDIASYLNRFGVDLLATGISDEYQILELLEDGITLVQGPHIAAPGPVRPDLMSERPRSPAQLRRAQG